jgi:hypothetical protein
MRKLALLALVMTWVSGPAFSQVTQQAVAPNPVYPGGTTPTQTAPSITGGVPNPVSPFGIDPRTQLPPSSGQATVPIPQTLPLETPEPHLTPLGAATVQSPIGRSHPITTRAHKTTQRSPNDAGCGFACGGATE